MLLKNFSDKTFNDILKCAQGDLDKCRKIDLERWSQAANRDVQAVAEKARIKEQKRKQKEKNVELERVNKMIAEKSRKTRREIKQEDAIKKRANDLTQ